MAAVTIELSTLKGYKEAVTELKTEYENIVSAYHTLVGILQSQIDDLRAKKTKAVEALVTAPDILESKTITNAQKKALANAVSLAHAILTEDDYPPSRSGQQKPWTEGGGLFKPENSEY